MKILLIIYFIITHFFITSSALIAQINPGARQIALAHSDVALSNDVFSIFNNPAGLAQIKEREIGIFYSPSPFGIKELANGYLAYVEPAGIANFSLGAMTYGFKLFKENIFNFAISKNISEKFYFGISFKFRTVNISKYGNDESFDLSLGSLFRLHENLSLGFSLHNPLRNSSSVIELPTIYNLGISYQPLTDGSINLALLKELEFPFSIRFGVEYPLVPFLFLRVGVSTEPELYNCGLGIYHSFLKIDYALSSHQSLGLTHQIGIIINFN